MKIYRHSQDNKEFSFMFRGLKWHVDLYYSTLGNTTFGHWYVRNIECDPKIHNLDEFSEYIYEDEYLSFRLGEKLTENAQLYYEALGDVPETLTLVMWGMIMEFDQNAPTTDNSGKWDNFVIKSATVIEPKDFEEMIVNSWEIDATAEALEANYNKDIAAQHGIEPEPDISQSDWWTE